MKNNTLAHQHALCIHIGRAWSRVKAQVEAETDERASLHQEVCTPIKTYNAWLVGD